MSTGAGTRPPDHPRFRSFRHAPRSDCLLGAVSDRSTCTVCDSVTEDTVRSLVGVREGDQQPSALETAAIERRLRELPGVLGAEVSVVCCEEGRNNMYVGITSR